MKKIAKGTLIKAKPWNQLGLVIEHDRAITALIHSGIALMTREEATVLRDQSEGSFFIPMRFVLPYGKWTCTDGKEILFNRDYCPIWYRDKDGFVDTLDPATWIEFEKQEWFFGDTDPPWQSRKTYKKCKSILGSWGAVEEYTKTVPFISQVLNTGKTLRELVHKTSGHI